MILLLSTSDTDLLSARASGAAWRPANPTRVADLAALLDGADLVVVRILGGRRTWADGLDAVLAAGLPVVVLGGEQAPDAELMELSTVPVGVAAEAHRYLAEGGPANLAQLHAFLSDTVLLTGEGFEPPVELPSWGILTAPRQPPTARPSASSTTGRTSSRGTPPSSTRCAPRSTTPARARCRSSAPRCAAEPALLDAARGRRPGRHRARRRRHRARGRAAGGDDEAWDVAELAALDVPILQGLCLTSSRADWAANDDGLSPLDAATQVAIPEFDGRIITVPFSFKEIDADGLPLYVADPERAARVAGIAVRHARLRHIPAADKRIALMLSAYPTKHARIGNAVGLDTPASAVALLRAMGEAGYDLRRTEPVPGRRRAATGTR